MDPRSQRKKGHDGLLSALNVDIGALNLSKEVSSITPAKAALAPSDDLLTMIRTHLLFCNYESLVHVFLGLDDQ